MPNDDTFILHAGGILFLQDEVFDKTNDSLTRLLMARKRMYEDEEHALRVMMTEQVSSSFTSRQMGLLV